MRFWIEDEYKEHKRGAFHGEHTKMTDPKRAERLYLVMAVAMQVAVLVGGALEAREQQPKRAHKHGRRRRVGRPAKPLWKPRGREQSCLERGCQAISAAVVRGDEVPMGQMVAENWPTQLYAVGKVASSWVRKRKHKEAVRRQRKSKQAEERRRKRAEQCQQEAAARKQEQEGKRANRQLARHECELARRDPVGARVTPEASTRARRLLTGGIQDIPAAGSSRTASPAILEDTYP